MLLLLWLALSTPSPAAPASDETIERLLQLTQAESTQAPFVADLQSVRALMAESLRLSAPSQKAQIAAWMKESEALTAQVREAHFDYAKVKPELAKAYRAEFSEAELKAVVAFAETPAGRKWIEAAPRLGPRLERAWKDRSNLAIAELSRELRTLTEKHFPETKPGAPRVLRPPRKRP